ncbi:MAG: peptidase S58 family protein [Deltaproteobacteria bacterium]|nr:MAG: peptidase S58 family protein [Deltaproteobacteria bacterium]
MFGAITDVKGIYVGHASNFEALTGCTVILCEEGAVGGVEIRGSAAGTRQLDALYPIHLVQRVHALLLTGGSSFGLDAAAGVMRYLEERGKGFDVGITHIPIVPTAVIFDLALGDHRVRPDAEMAYQACLHASSAEVQEGSVGVGTGATVGKLFELKRACKGGVGTASVEGAGGIVVGALVVVNALGDVVDDRTGEILAGLREDEDGLRLVSTAELLRKGIQKKKLGRPPMGNTTIGVVAANVALNKEEVIKVAQMAHNGLAKTISPVNTTFDGDIIFALSAGEREAEVNNVGVMAETAIMEAVKRAVIRADGFGILPAYKDLRSKKKITG